MTEIERNEVLLRGTILRLLGRERYLLPFERTKLRALIWNIEMISRDGHARRCNMLDSLLAPPSDWQGFGPSP